MAFWDVFLKGKKEEKAGSSPGDSLMADPDLGVFKAYIPEFLYKPPFGYPLNKNVPLLRNLAKNAYVYAVIRTLRDEASSTKWEIKVKKEFAKEENSEFDDDVKRISDFFYNPNGNDESFGDLLGSWIEDLCVIGSMVGVKVYTRERKFNQLFARDAGSFLKNPNIYGYIGDRDDYVPPMESVFDLRKLQSNGVVEDSNAINSYRVIYSERAAYFQYGWTGLGLPVPFGKKEIMYALLNPRSDSIYGASPIEILNDTLLTLLYGQQYHLDFYINGNLPDGLLHLAGADNDITKAFQERLKSKFRFTDGLGNNRRIGHSYPVYGGAAAAFIPFSPTAKDMEILEQQKWFTKLVWSTFGVPPDELGFTENSNKAVSQTQSAVHKRKALKPMLKRIEYAINTQLMPDLDPSGRLEFVFEDYDLDDDLKKHNLYDLQIRMGIKTAEMVAEEEGIDLSKLKASKAEADKREIEKAKSLNPPGIPDVKSKKKVTNLNDGFEDFLDAV